MCCIVIWRGNNDCDGASVHEKLIADICRVEASSQYVVKDILRERG